MADMPRRGDPVSVTMCTVAGSQRTQEANIQEIIDCPQQAWRKCTWHQGIVAPRHRTIQLQVNKIFLGITDPTDRQGYTDLQKLGREYLQFDELHSRVLTRGYLKGGNSREDFLESKVLSMSEYHLDENQTCLPHVREWGKHWTLDFRRDSILWRWQGIA